MTFELKPEDAQVITEAIQAGLVHRPDEVVEVGVETLRARLLSQFPGSVSSRRDAIRRMEEFADTYRLSLGERITRNLLPDGHRY